MKNYVNGQNCLVSLAALAVGSLVPTQVAAQQTGSPIIVVTAQKREQNLQDVPLSVTAIGGETLERFGIDDTTDLLGLVPGVSIVGAGLSNQNQISIRGISADVPYTAGTVGYYIDDTPVQIRNNPLTGLANPRFFDLERVEVLRGPQGTLYGASSLGGTLRFLTRQPVLDGIEGFADAELAQTRHGNLGYTATGVLNLPLSTDVAGLRVGGQIRRDGGFVDRRAQISGAPYAPATGPVVDDDVNDETTYAFRAILLLQATESLSITPSIYYQKTDIDDISTIYADDPDEIPNLAQGNLVAQPGHDRFTMPSLDIELDLGGATITSVTSYFDRAFDQVNDYSLYIPDLLVPTAAFYADALLAGGLQVFNYGDGTQGVFTQELRVASPDRDHGLSWIGGLYYRHSVTRLNQEVDAPDIDQVTIDAFGVGTQDLFGTAEPPFPNGLLFFGNIRTVESERAAFGELSWAFGNGFRITAGARISDGDVIVEGQAGGFFGGGDMPATRDQSSEHPITPKFALSYEADDFLLYAQAVRGVRLGGPNSRPPVSACAADLAAIGLSDIPTTFGSDSTWNFEVGAKTQPAAGLVVNAAAYWIQWSNIQQQVFLPTCGFQFVDNLGSARSRGFEVELAWDASPNFTLGASAGYTDARLSDNVFGGADPVTGQPVLIASAGQRILNTPDWTAAMMAEYRADIASDTEAYIRARLQYVGDRVRYFDTTQPGYRAEDYAVANFRIGARGEHWDAALFVDNAFDARPVVSTGLLTPVTLAVYLNSTLTPRTLGVQVRHDF